MKMQRIINRAESMQNSNKATSVMDVMVEIGVFSSKG